MKIVFVTCHYLNGNGGGVFASRAFINAFAEIADELVLLFPMKDGKEPTGISKKVRLVPVWDKRSKISKGIGAMMGLSNRFRKVGQFIGDEKFDFAVVDNSMSSSGVIDYFHERKTKVITIHHNYNFEYYRDNTKGLLYLPTLFWAVRFERQAFQKSDLNLTLTEDDKQKLKKRYGTGKDQVDVLGVFEYYRKNPVVPGVINSPSFLITGDLSAAQTENSLVPWIRDYYPILKNVFSDCSLTIAGKDPSPSLLNLASDNGIKIVSSPKTMDPLLLGAKYYVCTTSLGGGIKLRVMDGLSYGLPVICHEVSARGYETFVERNVLFVYNDKNSFESQLHRIKESRVERTSIIELYCSLFSFDSGIKRLIRILQNNHFI